MKGQRGPKSGVNVWSLAAWIPVIAGAGLIYAFSAQANLTLIPNASLDFVVTKLGHMAIFGIVALLLWLALTTTTLDRPWAWALVFTVIFAITDEIHQASVPGRTASAQDVAIDAAGAVIAVAIVGLLRGTWVRRRASP